MKTSRILIVLLMVTLTVVLVGCGGSGTTPPSTGSGATEGTTGGATDGTTGGAAATVVEDGFAFEPATLEVNVGDTVTFRNDDSAPHVVKIDGKELGNQATGVSVTWTPEKAGTFPYVCTIHPAMTGEIIVK